MTSRKQPGVAFWATVVVVVGLVAYPLSLGPVQCVNTFDVIQYRTQVVLTHLYRPLGLASDIFPVVEHAIERYVEPFNRRDK